MSASLYDTFLQQANSFKEYFTIPLRHVDHYNHAFVETTQTQSMTLTVMKFIQEFILETRKSKSFLINFSPFVFNIKAKLLHNLQRRR